MAKNDKLLSDDLIFKKVFKKEKYLRYFLDCYFEYIGSKRRVKGLDAKAEVFLQAQHKNKRDFKGDIVAILDNDDIISLEMYNNFSREQYVKSLMYATRLYSNQIKKNGSFCDAKKVISINLMSGNYHKNNPRLINIKKFVDVVSLESLDNDLEMILIRLDKLTDSEYNESDNEFINLLKLINTNDEKEMNNIMVKNKMLEEIGDVVKDYLNDPFIDSVRDNHMIEVYQSKQEGIDLGVEQRNIEVARNMLNAGEAKDKVKLYTGLSFKEIEKLAY